MMKIELSDIKKHKLGDALRCLARFVDDWENLSGVEIILREALD